MILSGIGSFLYNGALRRAALMSAAALVLHSCSKPVDESAMAEQRAKPVQRYDVALSAAANSHVALAGLQNGVILASTDHGASWQRRAVPGASIIDIAVCPDDTFVALDFYSKVWAGDANGESWQGIALQAPATALTVTCDPTGRWWVSGTNATIAVSADKGATWDVTDLKQDAQITALTWIDDRQAVAMGEFGLVAATRDGGQSWNRIATIPGDFYPYTVRFVSASEGYAAGIAGQVLRTQDGGLNWSRTENETGAPLYRLIAAQGHLYGVGAAGVVAELNGDRWRLLAYPRAQPISLSAAAALPGSGGKILIGGPGGFLRVISVKGAAP